MLRISLRPIGRKGFRKFHDVIYIIDGHNHRVAKRPKPNSSSLGIYSSFNVSLYINLGVSCISFATHIEFRLGLVLTRSNIFFCDFSYLFHEILFSGWMGRVILTIFLFYRRFSPKSRKNFIA